jgi:DNA repair protein RecO (recombination protein O)
VQRTFSFPALVLRIRPTGESNREAVFLSAGEGIISATLFGGPKSRLRSHVSPFNSGILCIYRDTAKDFRKVNDFDVQSWRPGLRELYERSNAASLIAGTVISVHGGGGAFNEAFTLVNAALDALETADENCCERILISFMWNWTMLQGNRGDVRYCASCACEPSMGELLWFVPEEGFLCKNCMMREHPSGLAGGRAGAVLSAGARRWLLAVQDKPPAELARYTLDAVSLGELKALLPMLTATATGCF